MRRKAFRGIEALRNELSKKLNIHCGAEFKGTHGIRYGRSREEVAVGDAMMTTHPLLGYGMKHACLSAKLLADCIEEGKMSDYPLRHKHAFSRVDRISRWVDGLYRHGAARIIYELSRNKYMYRRLFEVIHFKHVVMLLAA